MSKTSAVAAVVLVPLTALFGLALAGGAINTGSGAATVAAAATACTYANPDPPRITAAIEALTVEPVDAAHWATYAPLIGANPDTATWQTSTSTQRHQLLAAAVTNILNTTAPHAISTPVIIWFHATMPADNDDTTWHTTPVPGWDGTLDTYLQAFANTYATNPAVLAAATNTTCTPPNPTAAGTCPQPADLAAIQATIRHLESGGTYTEHTHSRLGGTPAASGNPTGAYQYTHDTWGNYAGYPEAYLAPAAIQDARAGVDITAILARFGSVEWVPVAWYVGTAGAEHVRNGDWAATTIPNPAYNTISIADYQTRWLDHYTTVALPATGTAPTPCPTGNTAVTAWADTQIGAPYAAINPYRYGTPLWPGGTITGFRGDRYTYPAGTAVYDCSGFVIAAWRTAGIDFAGQYGIYDSDAFNTPRIPDAPRDNLQPGDIAIYNHSPSGVGHIVLIHDIAPDGTIHTIEATGGTGVHIGTINWNRVIGLKRPTP